MTNVFLGMSLGQSAFHARKKTFAPDLALLLIPSPGRLPQRRQRERPGKAVTLAAQRTTPATGCQVGENSSKYRVLSCT
jgi:hypothetical protein